MSKQKQKKKNNYNSKKNNNSKCNQKNNSTNVELPEKLNLLLKHHILFWMLIFPPVAIYKLFKLKIVGKFTGALIVLVLLTILAISVISAINPTLVTNTQVSDVIEDMGYGEVREIEQIGTYHDLQVCEIITTKGFYTVYYDYSNNGKLFINSIIELQTEIKDDIVYNQFAVAYKSEKSDELLLQINPAAIKFIIKNDSYGDIKEVLMSSTGTQVFVTTKGQYTFNYQFYETTNIQKLNSNNVWEDVMNRDYIIEMKPEFKNALNQKNVIPLYYDVKEVLTYGITESEIYYVFTNFCGNKYRIVKFNNGKISLEHAIGTNPVAQEDLAQAWENYQKASNE